MPGGRPLNQQWRNQNSVRSYPLSEAASKRDSGDVLTIPDSLITGMQLNITLGLNVQPDKFFLRKLILSPVGVTLVLAYDDGSSYPYVGSVHVPVSTHTEHATYAVGFRDDFLDCDGHVQLGLLAEALDLPAGEYEFTAAAGRIDPDAVRPQIRTISSVTVENAGQRSARLYGDLTFVAGSDMRITATTGANPTITWSAVQGEGLNEDCECDNPDKAPPIRTINGIPPTQAGDFTFVGNNCLDIEGVSGSALLKFSDLCSEPCCGCTQLDAINDQLKLFADGRKSLEGLANRTAAEVTQMNLVVLASRLNDAGCAQC